MKCRLTLSLLILGVLVRAPQALGEFAAPETTEVFVGSEVSSSARIVLAHRFLLIGSETVTRGEHTLATEVDYRLDPDAGTLLVAAPLSAGEELRVTYSWVPIELPRDFTSLVRGEPTPVDSSAMAVTEAMASAPSTRIARTVDENLVIGGAKTVAIAVGSNKDAAVEQSLRVSVTGNVGKDVRLTALLSDQNIPLQPEGNTQRLENLDEVLIRVDGPHGSAALGDFVANRVGTAFGNFERRLTGAEASAAAGPGRVRGIGASTRGNFRTVEFRGEEGKQGPYRIAGEGLNPTGVIVAGSERVWLDGRPLLRGEVNDYVIDYSRGELEFTNRRLITKDTEIAIDFEVAEQDYRRNFYMGEGGFKSTGDAFEWRMAVASEADDNEPLSFTLSDEQRATLEGAGDEPVLVSSAVCDGGGDYDAVDDHFVYVGVDSGTCDVSFVFVGVGNGEYVTDRDNEENRTFFRHVGEGLGDYSEGVLLRAPRTNTLADLGLRLRAGGLRLEADGAYSQEDRNTFSSRNDVDNDGRAAKVALHLEDNDLDALGRSLRFRASSSFRGEEAKFTPLGRNRNAYLGEVWNFTDTTRVDEGVGEVYGQLEDPGRWSLGGSWGLMERRGLFRSERNEGNFSFTGSRIPRASFRLEKVRRTDEGDGAGAVSGDLLRGRGGATVAFGMFRPGVTYWKEQREDVQGGTMIGGQDEVEVGGTLGVVPTQAFRGDLRYARRTTDVASGGLWARQSVGTTYEIRAEANPRRSLRARFSWIRRDLQFEPWRPESDRSTVLTRTDLQHEGLGGLLRGEYVYKTTSRVSSDLLGGPTAEEVPSLLLNASARWQLGSTRSRRQKDSSPGFLERALSRIRSETVVRIEEETTNPDRGPIYLLDFSKFQSDAFTIFGRILLRQELTVFPNASALSMTARWERIDTEDNRAQGARLDTLTERFVFRARNRRGPRWTLESQWTLQRDRHSDSRVERVDYDNRLGELREELVWQPGPTTRISARGVYVSERNRLDGAGIRGITAGLTGSTAVLRNGRLRADAAWTHPLSTVGIETSRFRTRSLDQIDLTGSLDVRLSRSINGSVSYTGRFLEGTSTTHFARAEARALF